MTLKLISLRIYIVLSASDYIFKHTPTRGYDFTVLSNINIFGNTTSTNSKSPQHFVNSIISTQFPGREPIKNGSITICSGFSEKDKRELDKDIANINSLITASKDLVNDVFDFLCA